MDVIQYISFSVWLISFNMTFYRFILVALGFLFVFLYLCLFVDLLLFVMIFVCLYILFTFFFLVTTCSLQSLGSLMGVKPGLLWWELRVWPPDCQRIPRPREYQLVWALSEVCTLTPRPRSTKLPASSSVGWPSPNNQEDKNTNPTH